GAADEKDRGSSSGVRVEEAERQGVRAQRRPELRLRRRRGTGAAAGRACRVPDRGAEADRGRDRALGYCGQSSSARIGPFVVVTTMFPASSIPLAEPSVYGVSSTTEFRSTMRPPP